MRVSWFAIYGFWFRDSTFRVYGMGAIWELEELEFKVSSLQFRIHGFVESVLG